MLFIQVVDRVVDPLMQCIEDTAARLPSVDQAAYTLNCYYQIHSSLSLYEYVDERLENLRVHFLKMFRLQNGFNYFFL